MVTEIRTYWKLISEASEGNSNTVEMSVPLNLSTNSVNGVQNPIRISSRKWQLILKAPQEIRKPRLVRQFRTPARCWHLLDQVSETEFKLLLMKSHWFQWWNHCGSGRDQESNGHNREAGDRLRVTWVLGIWWRDCSVERCWETGLLTRFWLS